MMSDNSNDIATFLAGFLIGGLVGAAVALLMAPQSGEETRGIIRDKSIELKDKAVETSQEARVRAEKALEEARERADAAVVELRARTDELARMTKEKAAEIQHQVPGRPKPGEEVEVETGTEAEGGAEAAPAA
jgi:gas vesicle protein